jgi:hypothetical protein
VCPAFESSLNERARFDASVSLTCLSRRRVPASGCFFGVEASFCGLRGLWSVVGRASS